MNRLLALDGGGMRGVFTLEILQRVQGFLRDRYDNPKLVLADYFNFIGAAREQSLRGCFPEGDRSKRSKLWIRTWEDPLFNRPSGGKTVRTKYLGDSIQQKLRELFLEDDGNPALLGTQRLRSFLLLILRNASTGSTWPITNNPDALYNRRDRSHSNMDLPLWQARH